jgi:hypothetical protein
MKTSNPTISEYIFFVTLALDVLVIFKLVFSGTETFSGTSYT